MSSYLLDTTLDTHLAIWIPISDSRLSRVARGLLNDPHHDFIFSTASLWKMTIKRALGKPGFEIDPRSIRRELVENGYEELPIFRQHALGVDLLPQIHEDPFDRLLIAQAMVEGITLLAADSVIARYPGPIRKV